MFLYHNVRVRPGYSEAVHPCYPWALPSLPPIDMFRRNLKRQIVPVHTRVGIVEMQLLRYSAMLQCERRLYQSCDTGGRLQMSDVGLNRTYQEWIVCIASIAIDLGNGFKLYRIAYGSSCSVRF